METAAAVVFEHDFDEEMLAEFSSLRFIRLSLAERQLANLGQTVDELIKRGLVEPGDRSDYMKQTKVELTSKIKTIRDRINENTTIFVDELEFYLNLIKEE